MRKNENASSPPRVATLGRVPSDRSPRVEPRNSSARCECGAEWNSGVLSPRLCRVRRVIFRRAARESARSGPRKSCGAWGFARERRRDETAAFHATSRARVPIVESERPRTRGAARAILQCVPRPDATLASGSVGRGPRPGPAARSTRRRVSRCESPAAAGFRPARRPKACRMRRFAGACAGRGFPGFDTLFAALLSFRTEPKSSGPPGLRKSSKADAKAAP